MTRQRSNARRAASTAEVMLAIALLAIAAPLVAKFASQVRRGLQDREISARLEWELINVRERIGTWPAEQITAERIGQVPISSSLTEQVPSAKLSAKVSQVEKPVAATQVTLAVQCERGGQTIEPATLTFWVPAKRSEEP